MDSENFFTFGEYMKRIGKLASASMEDYLEMIYRLSEKDGFTRINELAAALNVRPPSATKMVQKLSRFGLIDYERYGVIRLKRLGTEMGKALIKRHNTIETFLEIMGVSKENLLEETEKIEHTISDETLTDISCFVEFLSKREDIKRDYEAYCKNRPGG